MAKELKNYNWDSHKRGAKPADYPWDKWTNGSTWQVVQGKDFPKTVGSFRAQLHNKAFQMTYITVRGKRYRWKVRTKLLDDKTVIFQFYKEEDPI